MKEKETFAKVMGYARKDEWIEMRKLAKQAGRTLDAVFAEAVRHEVEKLKLEVQNA